jgi:hypothetical protein
LKFLRKAEWGLICHAVFLFGVSEGLRSGAAMDPIRRL